VRTTVQPGQISLQFPGLRCRVCNLSHTQNFERLRPVISLASFDLARDLRHVKWFHWKESPNLEVSALNPWNSTLLWLLLN
jgi:hypothetical protein